MSELCELQTGNLTPDQIQAFLDSLPCDFTFIDDHEIIRYVTIRESNIFKRSMDDIGKDVRLCHKPASVKIIDEMVAKFRNGDADFAEGWVEHEQHMVYIRYSAVRSKDGIYLGILELATDLSKLGQTPGEFGKLAFGKL